MWKKARILCMLIVMIFSVSLLSLGLCVRASDAPTSWVIERKDARVYVWGLGGAGAHGVDNSTRVIDGVKTASRNHRITYWVGEYESFGLALMKFREVEINVSVNVVSDWNVYRDLVESGSSLIFVNAHGETVPVPAGYSEDEWIGKIADAMHFRNVTWVHVGGYPFYYSWRQDEGEHMLGEEGFKKLMTHIGRNNVKCWPPSGTRETDRAPLSNGVISMFMNWDLSRSAEANSVSPLKRADFEDLFVLSIWGSDFLQGAIIPFSEANRTADSGFYIHIGAGETYDEDGNKTDKDFSRGYAGAAAAVYDSQMKAISSEAIGNAQASIATGVEQGRIRGLGRAVDLLEEAKVLYLYTAYESAIRSAFKAAAAADTAVAPNYMELVPSIVVVGMIAAGVFVAWRINSRRVRWPARQKDQAPLSTLHSGHYTINT